MPMDISVIIPIYNEEENIDVLFKRLSKVMEDLRVSHEFIFINDGSRDRSIELIKALSIKYPQVKYIDFSRNFGHQVAVSAGLDHSIGNAVVIIDADLQDPPELIKDMYAKVLEGYQVVYAKRKRRQGESFLKLWTAKLFYRILSKITSVSIPVDTGDFRIMDKRIVEVLRSMPEKHKFLRGQISWVGFNQTYIEYDRSERNAGETGYTYSKMIRFALDGITAFSVTPLKLITFFGFFVSGFAFLMSLWALYARFISHNYEPGWASIIISVLFIGGIQMIALGIIGEYLMRMNSNVMDRPLYVVRESNIEKK
jgi:dolichol-phosphate mannosyltransferase